MCSSTPSTMPVLPSQNAAGLRRSANMNHLCTGFSLKSRRNRRLAPTRRNDLSAVR